MDANMLELVEKILKVTSFIAIGGTAAMIFVLLCTQSITGTKTIQKQLERVMAQMDLISGQLEKIARGLERRDGDDGD